MTTALAPEIQKISTDTHSKDRMRILAVIVPDHLAIAVMTPAVMKRLLFVSSFEVADPDSPAPRKHGYQRPPMESRLSGIAKYYLEDGHQFLITPITVSVRLTDEDDIRDFIELFNQGKVAEIHDRWHKAIVSIVDGQHRTLGFIHAQTLDPEFNPLVPVMMYFGLDYISEANLFDTINSTQRKLPTALIEVTKGDITEAQSESHAQTIREIAFGLCRDKESVWYDKVNMTGARDADRKVTYEGLRRSTANMFPAELVTRLLARKMSPESWARDYWRVVAEACDIAWHERPRLVKNEETGELEEQAVDYRLRDLVGVASVARLGKDITTSALEHKDPVDWMADQVSKLSEVDWEKREDNPWMRSHSGFGGQRELYKVLYDLVYLDHRPGQAV